MPVWNRLIGLVWLSACVQETEASAPAPADEAAAFVQRWLDAWSQLCQDPEPYARSYHDLFVSGYEQDRDKPHGKFALTKAGWVSRAVGLCGANTRIEVRAIPPRIPERTSLGFRVTFCQRYRKVDGQQVYQDEGLKDLRLQSTSSAGGEWRIIYEDWKPSECDANAANTTPSTDGAANE